MGSSGLICGIQVDSLDLTAADQILWSYCHEVKEIAYLQSLQLPKLFERMEVLKASAGVEEYSISQTTLEHVFVQLARQ